MAVIRIFFLLLFALPLCAKEKYTLSICSIFRNEARFLKEWIEYHRMVGVEHFYLFNHLSEDEYYPVLEPYIRKGIVELFDWPYEITSYSTWIQEIQCGTYNLILKERKGESRWLAVIDTDEFLLPKQTDDLRKFLKSYERYAAVGVNWQLYGTSDVWEIDWLLMGTLLKKAPKHHEHNTLVKCIVQPRMIKQFNNPHFPEVKPPYHAVTENKEKLKGAHSKKVSIDKIRINHYVYRDESFFYGEKYDRLKRKHPNVGPSPRPNPEFSMYEDRVADKYLKELEKRVLR